MLVSARVWGGALCSAVIDSGTVRFVMPHDVGTKLESATSRVAHVCLGYMCGKNCSGRTAVSQHFC